MPQGDASLLPSTSLPDEVPVGVEYRHHPYPLGGRDLGRPAGGRVST